MKNALQVIISKAKDEPSRETDADDDKPPVRR